MVVDIFSGTFLVLSSLFSCLHSRKNSYSLFQPPLELEVSGRGSFGQSDKMCLGVSGKEFSFSNKGTEVASPVLHFFCLSMQT